MSISLNTRFNNFVSWIRPDPDTRDDIRSQRDDVQSRICNKAESDGLTVRSTPNSGSFAKATGNRRHMLGDAEHEGQDIDCPFVVSPRDEDGDVLTELLDRFEGYAEACYPSTPPKRTKSSVKLNFAASKLSFDLVPMLAVDSDDRTQVLLRSNGERRRTSVQKHIEFIRSRTKKSKALQGRVTFNDGVRLVKWWREYQITQTKFLDEVPTFLLDLLCAKAFDRASVASGYAETLHGWLDMIQSYATDRTDVTFADFEVARLGEITAKWKVVDPVNGSNNAVPGDWGNIEIDELRDWARVSRDKVRQAIAYDIRGKESLAVDAICDVLGPSFKNHSET